MDVCWKSGSYPESVSIITRAGPAPTELTPEAKLANASANGRRISWLQENPKGAGITSRARYECYKGAVTIAAALSAGCIRKDLLWDLKHGFLTLHDPALVPPTAAPSPLASDAGGVVYEEWRHARLVLLSKKKGDLSFCKNWRGICLPDVCSKLLSSMLVRRLQIVMKEFGMDAQTGFRPDRGTTDGLFTTFVGLHKRKEHGLETWVLFIDLVKTFDTVPREPLFAIFCHFGLPDHFVNIIIRLHENALINVKIGEDD
jgi:hypothetical protein